MRRRSVAQAIVVSLLWLAPAARAQSASGPRIQLTLDTSEARQVLAILALRQSGQPIPDAQWQALLRARPYQRLKERQQKISEQFHDSTIVLRDDDFKQFVLSDSLLARAGELRRTLSAWERADLRASAERILTYLPEGAVIRATVYPMIKPGRNSFVWDLSTDPAIFLYLDPAVSRPKLENIVAHELHHIGLGSLGPVYDRAIAGLPERARTAADWMGSFGEGLAMLAAAGGPDVDPHAASTPQEHAQWQSELAAFDSDLPRVDRFFRDVLAGRLDKDSTEARASSFFGTHQGPWYTVGYRMAVLVEQRFGRPALIRTMTDYRCLLALYNRAAAERNAAGQAQLPLWSADVLTEVRARTCGVTAASSR